MENTLKDNVSIITGAASGIGRACARLLCQHNNKLVLVDINNEALEKVNTDLQSLPEYHQDNIMIVAVDISNESAMRAMAAATLERYGTIHNLIAAAGILRIGGQLKTIADTPLSEWQQIIDVNLTGTFISNQVVLPTMLQNRQGNIINISSTSGKQGRPFDGPYCASKFGIIGLSESLAEEVSANGVRVQCVLPDAVETPFWNQNGPVSLKPTAMLPAERVAQFIVYLLALPADTYLLNPVIAPLKTRKKRKS
ncbi:MAG: SDR family oxidoreductase [Gammaproteobacteria bacterium]|nr:SDR family oxidoreductase [Gammaproteobacteria bacterium]